MALMQCSIPCLQQCGKLYAGLQQRDPILFFFVQQEPAWLCLQLNTWVLPEKKPRAYGMYPGRRLYNPNYFYDKPGHHVLNLSQCQKPRKSPAEGQKP